MPPTTQLTHTSLTATRARQELHSFADPEKAKILQRFFKTSPGEYGEGDIFIGLNVPTTRTIAKRYGNLPLSKLERLLRSKIHEERLLALFILVHQSKKAPNEEARAKIARFYLQHRKHVNNWDLVDCSAEQVIGAHLFSTEKAQVSTYGKKLLRQLARSRSLWDRRIAILTTLHFIRRNSFGETLALARILLKDEEDLIHKAVGWMLREMGKRSLETEEKFLAKHAHEMPRTMFRYAIERLPAQKRLKFLGQSAKNAQS